MKINQIPKMNMDISETKCCPKFDPTEWEDNELQFKDKLFAVGKTISFFHIPLNIGSMFKNVWKKVMDAKADPKNYYLVLSFDKSPWRGVHYFAVEKEVPGLEMKKLSGTFLTRVFEGPYSEAGKWYKEMEKYAESKGKKAKEIYFFYTTCPKCLKHWGKNYVVGLVSV